MQRILMIDDDADIRRIGQLSLKNVGKFEVWQAKSGPEALSILEASRPDVILLDVMMPGMDGPTTFRKIRAMAKCEHIPIIFMTAKVQRQEVDNYFNLGAVGVISKPFDPMTLPRVIRDLLNSDRSTAPHTVSV